jgi:hypothetical protein
MSAQPDTLQKARMNACLDLVGGVPETDEVGDTDIAMKEREEERCSEELERNEE